MDSAVSGNDQPFEVRDAGPGKGLGCFATRDIIPGEIIIRTYSSIFYDDGTWGEKINALIKAYESADEAERKEWAALHCFYREEFVISYKRLLSIRRPDGSYFTKEQQELLCHLFLIFDANAFGSDATGREQTVLWIHASRFNHSCDPNVSYECSIPYRWVGRANRHINKGEELHISYIPTGPNRRERQAVTKEGWGFVCACAKCVGGLDTYTASLKRARDITNGLDGSKARPLAYGDDIATMAHELLTRIELLRELVEKTDSPQAKKPRQRELTLALWEGCLFHARWHKYWAEQSIDADGGDSDGNTNDAEEHARIDLSYAVEALQVAKDAWTEQHDMWAVFEKMERISRKVWDKAYGGKNPDDGL